ncbi:uncharacterized protein OCT59_002030 [Rhizophagus irregularis]|uniref:uncharacterized protein n=1 Tax=Rhizophagus irregularis TaxID=588596 RepID=UPI0019DB2986|nr:hypothetical protein OCT59_002030 [Rhizophagus irregularis]GET66406.1 hypothetical protein RIR_jg38104.t1 [Rhizophagus irregularis DAOM 181602=DAOM 197198]CAG8732293.1 7099_t:CDS:2 [Rhizophagus irregularis]
MPSNVDCDIGKSGNSVSCSNKTKLFEPFDLKCSIQTCKISKKHTHRLCVDCEKLFNERKRQLILSHNMGISLER